MTGRLKKKAAILISGRGSNMGALIEAAAEPDFPAEIVGVVSNRADAKGLGLAAEHGIATQVIGGPEFADARAEDAALDEALSQMGAQIVCLGGYMRILGEGFVRRWSGKLINIHPSLLPLFKGLHTHRRALEAGMRIHGCSVHFVTPKMDDGPIIAQAAVPVLPGDDEASLTARVLRAEHRLYPLALSLVASGKARMQDGRAVVDAAAADGLLLSPAAPDGHIDIESLARMTP